MFREKFGKSSVPKNEHPSEEELERARKAYEEADPTRFSPLPLDERVMVEEGKADPNRYSPVVQHKGERFVRLAEYNHGAIQQMVALLLKGIVPVADVVQDTTQSAHYSKVLNHSSIKDSNDSVDEFKANKEILSRIFGDGDHQYFSHDPKVPASFNHNLEHHDRAVSFYDFGRASFYPFDFKGLFVEHSEESARILLSKLLLLQQRISGKEGYEFLEALYAKTHIAEVFNPGLTPEKLQEILLMKITGTQQLVHKALQSMHYTKGSRMG